MPPQHNENQRDNNETPNTYCTNAHELTHLAPRPRVRGVEPHVVHVGRLAGPGDGLPPEHYEGCHPVPCASLPHLERAAKQREMRSKPRQKPRSSLEKNSRPSFQSNGARNITLDKGTSRIYPWCRQILREWASSIENWTTRNDLRYDLRNHLRNGSVVREINTLPRQVHHGSHRVRNALLRRIHLLLYGGKGVSFVLK